MSYCNLCAISNILSHINKLYSDVQLNVTAEDMCCFSSVILKTFYTDILYIWYDMGDLWFFHIKAVFLDIKKQYGVK